MVKISFKYIFLVFIVLILIFLPFFVLAQCTREDCPQGQRIEDCCPGGARNPERGLVPCGTPCCPCQLCDFFVLIDRIIDFLLIRIAPVVAILMLVIGGGLFLVSTGNPQTITTAKRIITSVFIGLVIIYGAYFFIGLILQSIGLADWTQDIYRSWWERGVFEIRCGAAPGGTTTTTTAPPVTTTTLFNSQTINPLSFLFL